MEVAKEISVHSSFQRNVSIMMLPVWLITSMQSSICNCTFEVEDSHIEDWFEII